MKKYVRLIVFVIAVISLVGLLIYRSEYVKLRGTFEYAQLFGSEEFTKDCLVLNNSGSDYAKPSLFSKPSHHWTRVDNFYVFSAFWRSGKDFFKSVALGVSSTKINFKEYACHIWYHTGGSLFSVSGKLSSVSSNLASNDSYLHEFSCQVEKNSVGFPYMFVFVNEVKNTKYFIPIFFKSEESSNNSAICVFPDYSGLERTNIIEFLSYHKLAGFTDVIVYDNGIQHGVLSVLQDVLPTMNFLRSFSVLNWQFPFDDIKAQEIFIKRDCLLRVFTQVEMVSYLRWDEYIIPRKGMNILSLFDHRKVPHTSKVFNLPIQRCCTELKNDKLAKQSWPTMLKKTLCTFLPGTRQAIVHPTDISDTLAQHISTHLVVINSYDSCEKLNFTDVVQDKAAFKFISGLMSSELLRLLRSGLFFKN